LDVELLHIPSSSGLFKRFSQEKSPFLSWTVPTLCKRIKGSELGPRCWRYEPHGLLTHAKSEIKSVSDLRGKKIGITRIGSSTHTSALYTLNQAGLKPSDYQILPLVEVPNIFTALAAGQVDAGVVSPRRTVERARPDSRNWLIWPRRGRNMSP